MKNLLIAVCVLGLAAPARASSGGADPLNFLFLDANARPAAMGGAYTAVTADANALLYNPAGLGLVKRHEATFMHNEYFQGMTQEYAAYASPYGVGANLNLFSFGSVPETTLALPGGTGNTNTLEDMALSAGYGRIVAERLSVGASFKYIQEAIAGIRAHGYALDAGALYSPPFLPELTLGGALQNMGPSVRFQSAKENLPYTLRAGAAYAFTLIGPKAVISLDVIRERSDSLQFASGGELLIAKVMAVRAGFATTNNAGVGVTAGVGWVVKDFALDYAFVPYGELGVANRVSLTYRWGQPRKREEVPPAEEGPQPVGGWNITAEQRFSRANQFIEIRRFDAAREELEQASKLLGAEDRRRSLYYERLGHIAYLENKIPEAKAAFEEGLRFAAGLGLRDVSVAEAYAGMGLCLVQEKQPAYALKFFQKAMEVGPSERTKIMIREKIRELPDR